MNKILLSLIAAGLFGVAVFGCSYGGIGASGDKAVVARNDGFLFGALRSVYVCKVTDAGLTSCQSGDAP
jgi:hypothetical protein